jgi:hypothetical protein
MRALFFSGPAAGNPASLKVFDMQSTQHASFNALTVSANALQKDVNFFCRGPRWPNIAALVKAQSSH